MINARTGHKMRFLDGTRRIPDSSISTAVFFGLSCEAAVLLSILEARDSSCPVDGTESGYTCSVCVVLHTYRLCPATG